MTDNPLLPGEPPAWMDEIRLQSAAVFDEGLKAVDPFDLAELLALLAKVQAVQARIIDAIERSPAVAAAARLVDGPEGSA